MGLEMWLCVDWFRAGCDHCGGHRGHSRQQTLIEQSLTAAFCSLRYTLVTLPHILCDLRSVHLLRCCAFCPPLYLTLSRLATKVDAILTTHACNSSVQYSVSGHCTLRSTGLKAIDLYNDKEPCKSCKSSQSRRRVSGLRSRLWSITPPRAFLSCISL